MKIVKKNEWNNLKYYDENDQLLTFKPGQKVVINHKNGRVSDAYILLHEKSINTGGYNCYYDSTTIEVFVVVDLHGDRFVKEIEYVNITL